MANKLIKCMEGIWNSGTSQGEGWSYEHFEGSDPTHFFVFYTRDNETGVPIHISAQGTESECSQGDGVYIVPAFVWIGGTPTEVGRAELKVQSNQKIDLVGLLCDFTAFGQVWQIRERMIDCAQMQPKCKEEPPVEPNPPGGFPPYTSARFNVTTSSLPDFPFGSIRDALNSDVFQGELVVDCVSYLLTAPLWGAINAGRITQNPDNGSLSIWFSSEPASRDLIDQDLRAAGTGFQLNWMLPGGSPQTDRYPFNPGERYYVNFAFCDSNIWRTEGRIVGIKPGISEVRADCTLG